MRDFKNPALMRIDLTMAKWPTSISAHKDDDGGEEEMRGGDAHTHTHTSTHHDTHRVDDQLFPCRQVVTFGWHTLQENFDRLNCIGFYFIRAETFEDKYDWCGLALWKNFSKWSASKTNISKHTHTLMQCLSSLSCHIINLKLAKNHSEFSY